MKIYIYTKDEELEQWNDLQVKRVLLQEGIGFRERAPRRNGQDLSFA